MAAIFVAVADRAQPAYAGVVLRPGDFVLGSGGNTVYWLAAAGGDLQTLVTNNRFDVAGYAATGPNGEIYIADNYFKVDDFTESGSIVRVSPSNGELTIVTTGGLGFMTGLAVGSNGTLYSVDQGSTGQQISRIDPVTGVRTTVSRGGLLREPYGVAVEADGSILTTADVTSNFTGPRQIVRIRAGSNQQQVVSTGGSFVRPISVAVSPDGSILVIDEGGNITPARIFSVHPQTGVQTLLTIWPSRSLRGMTVDAAGSLYVFGFRDFVGQGLYRIDLQTGVPTLSRSLGYSQLFSLAVVKVASEVSCAPRPPVTVKTSALGNGRLQVTVKATGDANTVKSIGFGTVQNASVEGQPIITGADATFVVKRTAAGASTLPFTVVDGCGEWKTFVGGGPNAF